ncbi:hypothetical protein V5799_007176 [Amblyomma americanum]|uniref:Carboxylesterase type B domain-containing protein n=1 Tax=Amblyomma americanum TaxID=6943 RepID=A0AAQ4DUA3_AMBAM
MGDFRTFFLWLVAACLVISISDSTSLESPVIKTESGLVSGVRETIDGKEVDMYLGIPYAETPIGALRFSKPVPAKPWNGTLAANKKPKPCPQTVHYLTDEVSFDYTSNSEDCLYLNIRKPAAECEDAVCDTKLPVVVFLHGDSFQWGDSGLFTHDGGNFAALSETIFVSFNYRLNVFGFLSAGNEDVSGNWGLWDQNLALKWVERNIRNFGGEPSEVTLIGHGAGGIAAGFHAISPQSSGLFKRMMLLSGSPMNILTRFYSGSVDSVIELGRNLTCQDLSKPKLGPVLECLREMDKNRLIGHLNGSDFPKDSYGPIYGDEYLPDDPFLLSTWKENMKSKGIMIGNTNNEGTLFLYRVMKMLPRFKDLLIIDPRSAIERAIRTAFRISAADVKTITKAYFSDWSFDHGEKNVIPVLGDIFGDGLFLCPATFFADAASEQKIPVFRYVFDYRPSFSFWPSWFKVTHGDDIPFTLGSLVFYGDQSRFLPGVRNKDFEMFKRLKYTSQEKAFMKEIVASVAQFVKTGRPMIPGTKQPWPRYSSFDPAYINIAPGNTSRRDGPKHDLCMIWKRILMKSDPETSHLKLRKKPVQRVSTTQSTTGSTLQGKAEVSAGVISTFPAQFSTVQTIAWLLFALTVWRYWS